MFDELTQSDVNAAAKMELRDDADAPIMKPDGAPMTITLLGKDSDAYVKQDNANTNRRLAQGTRLKITAEALRADSIALLARCTVGWDFATPCTYEAAIQLYNKFPAIKEQADAFITDRGNFTRPSPTT